MALTFGQGAVVSGRGWEVKHISGCLKYGSQGPSEGTFLSPFVWTSGILLLGALLLYHHMLRQGESVYYSSYKISWIIFTAYLNVLFLFISGECLQGP